MVNNWIATYLVESVNQAARNQCQMDSYCRDCCVQNESVFSTITVCGSKAKTPRNGMKCELYLKQGGPISYGAVILMGPVYT